MLRVFYLLTQPRTRLMRLLFVVVLVLYSFLNWFANCSRFQFISRVIWGAAQLRSSSTVNYNNCFLLLS